MKQTTHPSSESTAMLTASWAVHDMPQNMLPDRRRIAPATPMQDGSDSAIAGAALNSLRRIRLELNQSTEFPHGCHQYGFEFIAPLNSRRHIDLEQWRSLQRFCNVRSFQPGCEDRLGRLVHCADDDDIAFWAFDHDAQAGDTRHENRFGAHAFVPGEYVSIRNAGAREDLFRVIAVTALR